jgi:hypothetical protein
MFVLPDYNLTLALFANIVNTFNSCYSSGTPVSWKECGMKQSVRSNTIQAGAVRTGMVVQTNVFLWFKGWRVVTHTAARHLVELELNKTGERANSVIYDTYRWYDLVTYQVDADGKPVMVEVEDRVKKKD